MNDPEEIKKATEQEIQVANEQAQIFEMRRAGMTFDAIAAEFGCSKQLIHRKFKNFIRANPLHELEEWRVIEADRLEWALQTAKEITLEARDKHNNDQALRGLMQYLAAEKSIRELTGANAPIKQEVLVISEELLEQRLNELREENDQRERAITVGGSSPE